MQVLHALCSRSGALLFWAEDTKETSNDAPRVEADANPSGYADHPFASTHARLVQGLSECFPEAKGGALNHRYAQILLPSHAGLPLFSSVKMKRSTAKKNLLSPWNVPICKISPRDSLALLHIAPWPQEKNTRLGSGWKFFAKIARFSFQLVLQKRVLPELIEEVRGEFHAKWSLHLEREDLEQIKHLAAFMPKPCLSDLSRFSVTELDNIREGKTRSLMGPAPEGVVLKLLERWCDIAARCILLDDPSLKPFTTTRSNRPENAAARWVEALTRVDHGKIVGPVKGEEPALRRLGGILSDKGFHKHEGDTGFRTCFRLLPPDRKLTKNLSPVKSAALPWSVEILLQSTQDPSLQVLARDVWSGIYSNNFQWLARAQIHPKEQLLSDIGRATSVSPFLATSLRGSNIGSFKINAEEVHSFLHETASALQKEGMQVLIPSHTAPPPPISLKLFAEGDSFNNTQSIGIGGICKFEWSIALGDELLTPEELKTLANLKAPLVQIRGEWVELKKDEIDAVLRFIEARETEGKMSLLEFLKTAQEDLGDELPPIDIETSGWLTNLLADDSSLEDVPTPKGFVGTLRPYQSRGLSWLSFLSEVGLGACLADDMGLGKTVQLIALLLHERETHGELPPTLLICPLSVLGNWQREVQRFGPSLRIMIHHGPSRLQGKRFLDFAAESDLIITTYGLAARDSDLFGSLTWGRITLDEAQHIKNRGAKQTRATTRLKALHRVALTGTPVENRLSELHSIMEFLNPGILGSEEHFRREFSRPIETNGDAERISLLRKITGPFILRRVKTDLSIIQDLPDKIERQVDCFLTREQASLYQAIVDNLINDLGGSEGIQRRGQILASMTHLKQVCDHPILYLKDESELPHRSGKLNQLESLIEVILAAGDRALCFTQFAKMGRYLQEHIEARFGCETLRLDGKMRRNTRDECIDRFQAPGGPPIFFISLKAGGTGLNLTAANHVIHFDRWWNPAVEDQATDRAFRIGQTKNVQVHKFVCLGTIEERIAEMIDRKRNLAEQVIYSGEGWLTELSTSSLQEMVSLSQEVIEQGEDDES